MILCEADPDVVRERAAARAAGRHPVHRETDRRPGLGTGAPIGRFPLPDVEMPVLRVRTDSAYDPPLEDLVRWARTTLQLPR